MQGLDTATNFVGVILYIVIAMIKIVGYLIAFVIGLVLVAIVVIIGLVLIFIGIIIGLVFATVYYLIIPTICMIAGIVPTVAENILSTIISILSPLMSIMSRMLSNATTSICALSLNQILVYLIYLVVIIVILNYFVNPDYKQAIFWCVLGILYSSFCLYDGYISGAVYPHVPSNGLFGTLNAVAGAFLGVFFGYCALFLFSVTILAIGFCLEKVYAAIDFYKPHANRMVPAQSHFNQNSSMETQTFKSQYEQYQCPISFLLIRVPLTLRCGHYFEKQYLKKELKIRKLCPVCRRQSKLQQGTESKCLQESIKNVRLKAIKMGKQQFEKITNQKFQDLL